MAQQGSSKRDHDIRQRYLVFSSGGFLDSSTHLEILRLSCFLLLISTAHVE